MGILQELIEEKKLRTFEGSTGVKNLCKLVGYLGYKDQMYMGQFVGGSYGDLIEFLEDNPGACDAIVEFIEQHEELYRENIESFLPEKEEEPNPDKGNRADNWLAGMD
jgi:hypothetical protein